MVNKGYLNTMRFSESSNQAADFLRQAIPKMVEHNIVPNPLNYTLWYSYYSNAFPALNADLEHTISRFGTCPQNVSENLFLQHISQLDESSQAQLESFQRTFSQTINTLSTSIGETAKQTNYFSSALKQNIDTLGDYDLDRELSPVLDELSSNADAICAANDEFQGQLSTARAEIDALKKELHKSRMDANTDQLTGLYNRRAFDAIYREFKDSKENEDLALIIMDIDKFKVFNDTHGHLLGDKILQFVATLLKKECPESIMPARFGGEEFAILCPKLKIDQAQVIAESIRKEMASKCFSIKNGSESIPPVTASFGVAFQHPDEPYESFVGRADKALYQAKDSGRNRVMLAD